MMYSSRRKFLGGLGAISALASLQAPQPPTVEYVGNGNAIDVFKTELGRRIKTQRLPSERPSSLTLDRYGELLFAANEIDSYQGLPAGSVESYSVQSGSGALKLISRQVLSLSATMPRHLAVAPDRRYLVVAAFGGGAYNVLPIHSNGELGSVIQIVKEIGHGADPEGQRSAHPHSVMFHPSGKFLLGTDLGSDRINVFKFAAGRMTRAWQMDVEPGSGPAEILMDAEGSSVVVKHEFSRLVSCYHFDAIGGRLALVHQYKRA